MDNTIFNKTFKGAATLIHAPLSGEILGLEDVKDPMFATNFFGEGIAIKPTTDILLAPCDGVVKFIHSHNHVIIIQSQEGFDILMHIGLNTKSLPKNIYSSLVSVGGRVKVGDPLIKFDKEALISLNKSPDTVILAHNFDNSLNKIKLFSFPKTVHAGKTLLFVISNDEILNSKEFEDCFKQLNENGNNMNNQELSKEVVVVNHSGLHARPAAFLANLTKNLTATVSLKKGDKVANAKSLIEVLGLGINYQDVITIMVTGEDAQTTLDTIVQAFADGLGEPNTAPAKATESANKVATADHSPSTTEVNNELVNRIKQNESNITLSGVVVYPNIVVGQAFLLKNEEIKVVEASTLTVAEEQDRLNVAITKVRSIIQNYIHEARSRNKVSQAEIFSAHLEVLKDDFLLNIATREMQSGKTAEYAFKTAADKTCEVLIQANSPLLKERVADIRDIEKNILTILEGKEIQSIKYPKNTIIIAEDLTPSKITTLDNNVKGVILAKGSNTSHISIMMKNDGIPSMVALGDEILNIKNGSNIILNSREGVVIINPSEQEIQSKRSEIEQLIQTRNINLANRTQSSVTLDGVAIKVLGNVGSVEQSMRAYEMGGEGIGLVRSEFLFMNNKAAPSEEEQYKVYQDICDSLHGFPVIVRTLDVGGDKPIPYMNLPTEENPIMGLRGVRNYHLNKEIFISQIRALLRVHPAGVCKIMLPMISGIEEVISVKNIIAQEKEQLGINTKIEVGIMVEVPSTALLSKQFAKYVDFFSIGTNDLAQYILAMDRGHNILTKHINNLNPALLKAINYTCEGAKEHNIPVGVCGAMASEIECVPILIGLGVTSLSCGSEIIPDVKALIRNLDYEQCRRVAQASLSLDDQEEVKTLVYKEFGEYL